MGLKLYLCESNRFCPVGLTSESNTVATHRYHPAVPFIISPQPHQLMSINCVPPIYISNVITVLRIGDGAPNLTIQLS